MPHVIVKLYPGRSELQKTRLAEEIAKDVVAIANCKEESVSVAIEEIKPEDWAEKVYRPDILENPQRLYRKPGYDHLVSDENLESIPFHQSRLFDVLWIQVRQAQFG